MLTKLELAQALNVHVNTISNQIKKGLPCIKVGTTYRFDLEEVKQWLKEESKKG